MAGYHLVIKKIKRTEELGAMDFADDAAAVAFGNGVIRDLMGRAAKQYDDWIMEIREGERPVGIQAEGRPQSEEIKTIRCRLIRVNVAPTPVNALGWRKESNARR